MSSSNTQRRKPLDSRIPALIQNSLHQSHRSFFLLVGDRAKAHSQIVNLHFLLSQAIAGLANPTEAQKKRPRPNVLWCYKHDLGFTTHRKKREQKIKQEVKRGQRDLGDMDPFELFVSVTDVRYTYYKDTHKILGQTFQMLVLQDFEALTPNLLARTIETVEGGGVVVCLLQGMSSLRNLYSMTMDVHSRYRSNASTALPVARFNERFLLSLGANPSCLVVDDELNVLPISAGKDIVALDGAGIGLGASSSKGKRIELEGEAELVKLKDNLRETKGGVGELVAQAKTLDQAKAVLTFAEAITAKTLAQTVSLTAARGRGKSAALGLSVALAVVNSYSNIFVTSPSPENLKTLFEFVFKGFDSLGWEEHLDYDIVQSTNPEWKGAVVRVNIFRQHRQTIQYIQPQDHHVLGQAELVVIDEAAAIPLPTVRSLLGPYLVFMASTINGYEGTGRSLSLKLLQQLRELSRPASAISSGGADGANGGGASSSARNGGGALAGSVARSLKEVKLTTPIRYGPGDQIEKWLNQLLCLDATLSTSLKKNVQGCPHPAECELFYVNRDTLFSYHPASELFLQRMMALYVASHYKNSPNDLQLMSDAPGQHLFVLLPPVREDDHALPDPLVVVQVALEGNIAKETVMENLSRGKLASGDMIPWTMSQQYQDDGFASLSGARVVRIATHPDYSKMGYGARAVSALNDFYSGKLLSLREGAEPADAAQTFESVARAGKDASLQTDKIAVRDAARMQPLLQHLSDRQPEALDWMGVSFGLTPSLFRFWKRSKFVPMYLRQTVNDITGEHTCLMLRPLDSEQEASMPWLKAFADDFRRRFLSLLSFKFREFQAVTALSVLEATNLQDDAVSTVLSEEQVRELFSPFDLKRLESYSNNMLDYHVILDLLPALGGLYFSNRFPADVKLSGVQSSILLALGMQRKSIEDVESELGLPVAQALALFVKTVRKLTKSLQAVREQAAAADLPDDGARIAAEARAFGQPGAATIISVKRKAGDASLGAEDDVNAQTNGAAATKKDKKHKKKHPRAS